MAEKEAKARIKINKLLEESSWRFFDSAEGKANVLLENNDIQKKYFCNQSGVAIQNVMAVKILKEIIVALPPLVTQQEIVAAIEAERKIIDGCRELIVKYEEKIKKVVGGVWRK